MKTTTIVAAIIVALYLAYRFLLPYAFISMGRGSINADAVSVEKIVIEKTVKDDNGKPITADTDNVFATFYINATVPANKFDITEFQIVREKAEKIGTEKNIGDPVNHNYYFWTMLDETDKSSRFSISFQIPKGEKRGFLFFWGIYWGPYEFGS